MSEQKLEDHAFKTMFYLLGINTDPPTPITPVARPSMRQFKRRGARTFERTDTNVLPNSDQGPRTQQQPGESQELILPARREAQVSPLQPLSASFLARKQLPCPALPLRRFDTLGLQQNTATTPPAESSPNSSFAPFSTFAVSTSFPPPFRQLPPVLPPNFP